MVSRFLESAARLPDRRSAAVPARARARARDRRRTRCVTWPQRARLRRLLRGAPGAQVTRVQDRARRSCRPTSAGCAEEVRAAERAGADWMHLDVMDGHFVPNLTIGPDVVAAVAKRTKLPVDVHLMVREPDHLLEAFVAAGATALGVHVEACTHLHRTLDADPQARRAPVRGAESRDARVRRSSPVLGARRPGAGDDREPGLRRPEVHRRDAARRSARSAAWIDASRRDVDIVVDGGIGPDTIEQRRAARRARLRDGRAFFKSADYKTFVDGIRGSSRSSRRRA